MLSASCRRCSPRRRRKRARHDDQRHDHDHGYEDRPPHEREHTQRTAASRRTRPTQSWMRPAAVRASAPLGNNATRKACSLRNSNASKRIGPRQWSRDPMHTAASSSSARSARPHRDIGDDLLVVGRSRAPHLEMRQAREIRAPRTRPESRRWRRRTLRRTATDGRKAPGRVRGPVHCCTRVRRQPRRRRLRRGWVLARVPRSADTALRVLRTASRRFHRTIGRSPLR